MPPLPLHPFSTLFLFPGRALRFNLAAVPAVCLLCRLQCIGRLLGRLFQAASPHFPTQTTNARCLGVNRDHPPRSLTYPVNLPADTLSVSPSCCWPAVLPSSFFVLLSSNYLAEDEVAIYHPPTPPRLLSAEIPQLNNFRVSLSLSLSHTLSTFLLSLSCSN